MMLRQGLSHKSKPACKCRGSVVPNNSSDGYVRRWYHSTQETCVSVYCAAMRVNSPTVNGRCLARAVVRGAQDLNHEYKLFSWQNTVAQVGKLSNRIPAHNVKVGQNWHFLLSFWSTLVIWWMLVTTAECSGMHCQWWELSRVKRSLALLIVHLIYFTTEEVFAERVEGISCETQQPQIKTQWKDVQDSALSCFGLSPAPLQPLWLSLLRDSLAKPLLCLHWPFLAMVPSTSSSGADLGWNTFHFWSCRF